MVQYAKFLKITKVVPWRHDIGSINYLETSTWTRQEHNGFSHQNPSFIGAVLNLKPWCARVYFPPDTNCMLSTLSHCLASKNYVNLIVGSKQPTTNFLSIDEAAAHCKSGATTWKFASVEDGENPDVVLVGIGVEVTFEVAKAAEILQKLAPELRVKVVNVTDLMILGTEGVHPHALTQKAFEELFTDDKAVHFNYHGYASELQGLLFRRPHLDRVTVESYREEGSTTTPFDMMLLNHVSRFHVAEHALKGGARVNAGISSKLPEILKKLEDQVNEIKDYIMDNGKGKPFTHARY
jgi:xylulose-5-phosphate/fructose-6-phosphate phosphoketolase